MKTYKILFSFFLILMSVLGFSQSVPSYVPNNGLVGWWGFNGNAQDGSGNGNHGTVNGAYSYITDRNNYNNSALSLVGNNSVFSNQGGHFLFPENVLIDTISFTISIWVKPITIYSDGESYIQFGLMQDVPRDVMIHHSFNGLAFRVGNAVLALNSADTLYNNWQNFVISYTGNVMIVYKNGILYGSAINSNQLEINLTMMGIGRHWWGTTSNNNTSTRFYGKIDDIGIWNRALTPQEITNLYNSQLPAQTSLCLPTITTSSPTSVGVDTVVIGGDISSDGGSSIVLRGICYSTSPNPNMGNSRTEDGSGTGSFNTVLRGLTPSTTYYARSYAKNSNGVVVYGNEVSFTTSLPGLRCPGTPTVTDVDGNIYNTVQIGNQCWTQSNLKTTRYRNGDTISAGLIDSLWANTTSGAYAIYNNEPVNDGLYGKLYNNYSVTDSRGLCPIGWHVPSEGEWDALVGHVGGYFVAGGSLKSMATQPTLGGWTLPNIGATNSSGFTALPGGVRSHIGEFYAMFNSGCWWSLTPSSIWPSSFVISIGSHSGGASWGYNSKECGFSVRCLKNTIPQVNTTSVTNVTPSTALVTGEVISDGGDQNTTRGFCYSTASNPTILNDTTVNGMGIGVYSDTLHNLTPLTTYYVRAFATNSVGTSYGTELSFTTDSIQIGSNYAGGIVFYVDYTGQHGLVCAPVNQVDFIYWGNPLGIVGWGCQGGNVLINNGTEFGTSILFGAGLQNTINILNSCPYRPIAASLCHDLVLNGYSDWYLPSLNELLLMYNLKAQGIGNFNNFRYWSSSQHNQSLSVSSYYEFNRYAYAVDFTNGNYSVFEKTNQSSLTRAIRNF